MPSLKLVACKQWTWQCMRMCKYSLLPLSLSKLAAWALTTLRFSLCSESKARLSGRTQFMHVLEFSCKVDKPHCYFHTQLTEALHYITRTVVHTGAHRITLFLLKTLMLTIRQTRPVSQTCCV